jgi:hypothetical protein
MANATGRRSGTARKSVAIPDLALRGSVSAEFLLPGPRLRPKRHNALQPVFCAPFRRNFPRSGGFNLIAQQAAIRPTHP